MKINFFDIIVLSIITIALVFFYIGFYYPDEMIFNGFVLKLLLYAIRFLFPFLIIGVLWVYIGLRNGKINKSSVILTVISVVISLIIVLHVGLIRYSLKNYMADKTSQFHPFLQLMPNLIDTAALRDTSTYRIGCIGGSTTEFKDKQGVGWPEYLGRYFNKTKGLQKIQVFNFGRQWYSTLHILIHYQTNIRPYRPNVVILMEAINDLLHNADQSYFSAGPLRNDYGHFYGPVNRIARGTGFFEEYFCNRLLKLWYQKLKPREVLELNSFPGLASYKHNIQTIIDLARLDGTTVVLMTQPTLIKENLSPEEKPLLHMVNVETVGKNSRWSYASAQRGMDQYNNVMRSIATDRNVALIDLEKTVPKSTEYFYDDVHYQDKAYPLIVKTVADALISKSIIDIKYEN